MAYRQMHLNKSGSGMAAKTACGRSVVRTPMSTNWEEFKKQLPENQCAKCAASRQAELNRKNDEKKEMITDVVCYVPEKSKLAIAALAAKVAAKQGK